MLKRLNNLACRLRAVFSCSNPDVIVDFVFENGLFYLAVSNIGKTPAYRVSVSFDREILAVEGGKRLSEMALFRNIEFLAPGREIRTFLDTSRSYFSTDNPTRIRTDICYFNRAGSRLGTSINHDLDIYRDIGFIDPGPANRVETCR